MAAPLRKTRTGLLGPWLRSSREPGATGFFDYDRTSSGSSYHDRMVERRSRKRLIVGVAIALALVIAIVCAFVAASHGQVG